MNILPNNLKRQYELHAAEYEAKAIEVLRSGWYVLGQEVQAFEQAFADYANAEHCVGLASGLDALQLAFRILGIGKNDEVLVASNAYIACVMGITMAGATPVFVEPDAFYNIDTTRMEKALTKKTKAILAVHLYGQPCNMDAVMSFVQRHKLTLIEDCAQSHGAKWKGKQTGTFGEVGCFSFYPTKNCGAFGDAGAVVTNDATLAEKFRLYRNYGSLRQYEFETVGLNSRLDELQAGLLRVRLQHLEEFNNERRQLALRYLMEIQNEKVQLPLVQKGAQCVWHQFVVRCKQRDELKAFLKDKGIGTAIHYPTPPHLSKAYAHLGYTRGNFVQAESMADEVLSLPMYNGLYKEEQSYVIEAINQFL